METCLICTDSSSIFSVGECNHPVCYKCSTRLRALYNNLNCYMCKAPNTKVTFSSQKVFAVTSEEDVKLGIYFENLNVQQTTLDLLKFSCSFTDCEGRCKFIGKDFQDLRGHVKKLHSRDFCNLCIQFKKGIFFIFYFYRFCI